MALILPSIGSGIIASPTAPTFVNQYSVDLDGSDDFMATGSTFQSTFQSDHSISFWAKPDSLSTNEVIAGQLGGGGTGSRHYFQSVSGNEIRFIFNTGAGVSLTAASGQNSIGTDWFHCVGTVEQDGANVTVKVYIDGSLKGTASAAGSVSGYTSSIDYEIGKRHRPGSSELEFAGLIDEFAIIPSLLPASDVTAIYNSGVPDELSSYSPVSWWRMGDNDGGTGTTITDQGSGGNDGTLTNGPTFSTTVP